MNPAYTNQKELAIKWEYDYCHFCGENDKLSKVLNNWGKHGWEVVVIVGEGNKEIWFKKQIID